MKNHPDITNMHDLEEELHRLREKLDETESSLEYQWKFGKRNFLRLCFNSVKCGRRGRADALFAGSDFIKEIAKPIWTNFLRWISKKFRG